MAQMSGKANGVVDVNSLVQEMVHESGSPTDRNHDQALDRLSATGWHRCLGLFHGLDDRFDKHLRGRTRHEYVVDPAILAEQQVRTRLSVHREIGIVAPRGIEL